MENSAAIPEKAGAKCDMLAKKHIEARKSRGKAWWYY